MNFKGFSKTNVYVENKGIVKTDLVCENGKIASFENTENLDLIELDDKYIVIPGLIDRHIHGANGSDTMHSTQYAIENIATTLVKEGVTGFLPSTLTASYDDLIKALENIRMYMENDTQKGATVLGAHLEGPFISMKHKGAQNPINIKSCDVETFKKYQEASGDNIREVTFAYEENGKELCKYLVENNIVASIGHTDATCQQVFEAVKDGVTSATHTYNAMKGLHHREAGTLGGVMLSDEIYSELICDFIHVSKEACKLLYKVKGKDKITLITDALEPKHLPDGNYKMAGLDIYVKDKAARLMDGTLAGSTLCLNDAVRNMMNLNNISLTDAVDLASINPARVLKIDNKKGSIALGKDYDVVVCDKDLNVYMTICNGKIVYNTLD